jgi:hypothetical protein
VNEQPGRPQPDDQLQRARSERVAIFLILGIGCMAMLGFVLLGFAVWLDW